MKNNEQLRKLTLAIDRLEWFRSELNRVVDEVIKTANGIADVANLGGHEIAAIFPVPTSVVIPSTTKDDTKLVSVRTVCHMLGMSRTTLYRLRLDASFPKPVELSKNKIAWHRREIEDWLSLRDAKNY